MDPNPSTAPGVNTTRKDSIKFTENPLQVIKAFLKSNDIDAILKTYIAFCVVIIIVIVFIIVLCVVFAVLSACCGVHSYPRWCFAMIILLAWCTSVRLKIE